MEYWLKCKKGDEMDESKKINKLFLKLCSKDPSPFRQKKRKWGKEPPRNHGVYIIYSPGGKVLHVGKTIRGKNGILWKAGISYKS